MSERVRFVVAAEQGRASFRSLCATFGIVPKTGYKWLSQFKRDGIAGLAEKSRRPFTNNRAIPPSVSRRILRLRRTYPTWGPRKLVAWLEQNEPQWKLPAPSTVGDLLKAEGLIRAPIEKRQRLVSPVSLEPLGHATAPNALWSMDMKGWFRLGDRTRCDPFTVTDNYSRYLLRCVAVEDFKTECIWRELAKVFREFGMPDAIRVDNGVPWCATKGPLQLTVFSIRLIKLGIAIERIGPGKPQENGRHERFHLTLKQDTASPPAANRAAQQARFRAYQVLFNNERPHEALAMLPPATAYRSSSRPMPAKLPEPQYPADCDVLRVDTSGDVRLRGQRYFVTTALTGENVGVTELEEGCFEVRFCAELLGRLHRQHPELGLIPARRVLPMSSV